MLLVECLFSALLLVYPATPGMERYLPMTWMIEGGTIAGQCKQVDGVEFEIVQSTLLKVTYSWKVYIIPLPQLISWRIGANDSVRYRVFYVFDEDLAKIGDYNVMVRQTAVGWQ